MALKIQNSKKQKFHFFLKLQGCCLPNFRSFAQKLWPGASGHTYKQTNIHTYKHTYRGPKQGKPGRNRNSSQGSVLVRGHYWFVKQCWLVNITGFCRVQVSEKYRFLPQRFNRQLLTMKRLNWGVSTYLININMGN